MMTGRYSMKEYQLNNMIIPDSDHVFMTRQQRILFRWKCEFKISYYLHTTITRTYTKSSPKWPRSSACSDKIHYLYLFRYVQTLANNGQVGHLS